MAGFLGMERAKRTDDDAAWQQHQGSIHSNNQQRATGGNLWLPEGLSVRRSPRRNGHLLALKINESGAWRSVSWVAG